MIFDCKCFVRKLNLVFYSSLWITIVKNNITLFDENAKSTWSSKWNKNGIWKVPSYLRVN